VQGLITLANCQQGGAWLQIDFIRYHEVEGLLRSFQSLRGAEEVLRMQLQSILGESENETIESLALLRNTDGLPKSGGITPDRTGNIATGGLRKSNSEISEAAKSIAKDLTLTYAITRKMEIALNVLSPSERRVVELKYFEGLNWQEIADEMATSISTVQRHRRAGVERVRIVSRITVDDYNRIMKILDINS
jgi:RNA polymerase sigma factor (sigma-70 family)